VDVTHVTGRCCNNRFVPDVLLKSVRPIGAHHELPPLVIWTI